MSSFVLQVSRLLLVLALAVALGKVASGQYIINNLFDTSGPYDRIEAPKTNANGDYVFRAQLDSGHLGFFTGPDPLTDTVADTNNHYLDLGQFADINDHGTIVFVASPFGGGGSTGIYTGPDSVSDEIVDNIAGRGISTVAISNSGKIAYYASTANGSGIYLGPDPASDLFVDDTGDFSRISGFVEIGNTDIVAFHGTLSSGETGIFTGPNPLADAYADSSGAYRMFSIAWPTIVDDGTIYFAAALDEGPYGVFSGVDPTTDTFIDARLPPFILITPPAFNLSGNYVFQAALNDGATGFFSGTNAESDKIVQTGDLLFGSQVEEAHWLSGIDANGGFKFMYTLTDGRNGIAEAVRVPEPSSAVIALTALACLLVRRVVR